MKRYPKYYETGLDWLGELPSHWKLGKLGSCFEERSEKVSDVDYPALSVTKNGIIPQMEHVAKTDAGDNRKKVCVGDFVINSRSDRKGSAGISDYEGSVSLISIVLKSKFFLPEFAHLLFRSYNFQEEFYRFGKGIVADLWSTRFADMKAISVPLIPVKEQKIIANFLHKELTRIDELISEKQKFIKLLEEKRKGLISHFTTKGLVEGIEFKDSGVEWIGNVPAHWKMGKLKHLVAIRNGQDYKHVETEDEINGYPVYGSGGVFRYATDYLYDGESILFGRKGTVDKPLYVKGKFWSVDTMFYSEIMQNHVGRFIYYLSTTIPFSYYQTNTALPSMTQGDLLNNPVAIPPVSEQQRIADALDSECKVILELIDETNNSISLLKEHRSALISAAVTGKIDVREEV